MYERHWLMVTAISYLNLAVHLHILSDDLDANGSHKNYQDYKYQKDGNAKYLENKVANGKVIQRNFS